MIVPGMSTESGNLAVLSANSPYLKLLSVLKKQIIKLLFVIIIIHTNLVKTLSIKVTNRFANTTLSDSIIFRCSLQGLLIIVTNYLFKMKRKEVYFTASISDNSGFMSKPNKAIKISK